MIACLYLSQYVVLLLQSKMKRITTDLGLCRALKETLSLTMIRQMSFWTKIKHDGYHNDKISIKLEEATTVIKSNTPIGSPSKLSVRGDHVEKYWPFGGRYFSGEVSEEHDDGVRVIVYGDVDFEMLNMSNEVWRYEYDNLVNASVSKLDQTLTSNESHVLKEMMNVFANKPFLLHHAQGLEQYPLISAYKHKDEPFIKTVKRVSQSSVPLGTNIISSHTHYKDKINDDSSLQLKARIAPHGNGDTIKNEIKSNYFFLLLSVFE